MNLPETVINENELRSTIFKAIRKEIYADTRSAVDFIAKILNSAYESGMRYDIRDMATAIQNFAECSVNKASYCLKLCTNMHLCSDDIGKG